MVRTKDSLEKEDANFNYCFAKWQEFTTLTVEETENYRELVKFLTGKNILIEHQRKRPNREYKTKPVICKETQKIYESLTECAKSINSTLTAVSQAIKRKTRVNGKYTIEFI